MPYRKSYRRRRVFRRRRVSTRRIRSMIARSAEHKSYQVTLLSTFSSISTTWTEFDLAGPLIQGTDSFGQRVGRSITVIGLQVKGTLFGGAVGAGGVDDYYNTVRMCLLRMKQAKAGAALTPLATSGQALSSPLSKLSVPGLQHIYRDQYLPITNQPYGAGLCAPGHRAVNVYLKFKKPLKIDFAAAGAHNNQTQLYLSFISDSAAIPAPGFTSGWCRLIYTDA